MAEELRKTGISVVGDVSWGTHLCHFYETKEDLLDILIPYFNTGLENNEFCVWVVSDPLGDEEARKAFRNSVADADRYLEAGNIEIVHHTVFPASRQQTSPAGRIEIIPHTDWYLKGGAFIAEQVIDGWNEKLADALVKGYAGLRGNGNEAWLTEENRKHFLRYERTLDEKLANQRMIVLCSYPLSSSSAAQIFDVVNTHQLALIRRDGNWEALETPELKRAKQEVQRLNQELEQRVIERTSELAAANEELKRENVERKRAEALLHAKEHALRESQRLLEEAQRIAHVGHYEHDLETGVIVASDENYRILGLQPQDSISLSRAFELIHPDDRERVHQERDEAVRTGQHFEVEFRMVRPDGQLRYIHSQGDVIRDEQGRPRRTFGIAQDITERKQAEAALDERLRFETLVSELSAAFANLSPNEVDREIDKWLQTLAEFLGVDRASFFQFGEDWATLYRSHSYTVPGIEPLPPAPMGMKEQFPWITNQMRRGITVKWSRIPDDMPEEAANEKEYAAKVGAKSGLNIPVLVGGSVLCAISFTSIGTYHDWPEAMVARLRLVGEIFAAAVERKRAEAEAKQAEEKLKQSETQLAQAQRLAHIGSWDWDLRTNAVTWSDELYRIFGLQPGTINVAEEVDRFIHPDDLDLGWDTVKRAVASKEPYDYYHRILRPDGTERIARSRGSIMSDERGEPIKVFGATQDVTELKRAEAKLKATTEQLRALSANLQSAREEESKRIAREIHDELGGALTSWRWDLEEIRDTISEPLDSSQVAALQTKIEAMIKLTTTTLDIVRRLSSELRPMALDELGLVEAIEWQALQFQTRTGIAVEYEYFQEKVDLTSEQSTAVFRILQEALTNVLRHTQATKVTITVKQESGEFFLAIKDNGRGIAESEKSGAHSLGLLGMRERAHLIGAQIDITGIEGKGTLVAMRIPISESSERQKSVNVS